MAQASLNLDPSVKSVEAFDFEPIKGYPMLQWKGKRPFRSTHYYPAQHKETHGEEVNGWLNQIFWGDNLQVMSHLLKKYRGQIQLVYIDPPFDSKADYKKKVSLRGKSVTNDKNAFEEKQYSDIWTNDEYLQFMYERLILIKELLKDTGSIFLHCDWRKSHHLRSIMDEIFGPTNFRAQIAWRTMTSSGYKGKKSIGRSHADILYYGKSDASIYRPVYKGIGPKMLDRYTQQDEDGRRWKDGFLGDVTPETVEDLRKENKLYVTSGGKFRIKHYLDETEGTIADDFWEDINPENSQSPILTGYPTQKPEALLSRILSMCSAPGDLVFDCFMGSGTTQAVAMKLGRRFIGADINLGSIQTTTKRLINISKELLQESPQQILDYDEEVVSGPAIYSGFTVSNVNHYDVFRNPIQAKDLLIEALEIQPLPSGSVFDGEQDGFMVKIMPVNRIATKADLRELVVNIDHKEFMRRRDELGPNKPVEHIRLVCMGHDPDLAAELQRELSDFKLKIEVVDILRDRGDLEFKRDAQADIQVKGNKIMVRRFYPMNLLQKLSLQQEKIGDWRELVESVMIDFNYDGAVLQPQEVDIPEGKELVKGEYSIPPNAGTIRVKITDLLSESLEMTLPNNG